MGVNTVYYCESDIETVKRVLVNRHVFIDSEIWKQPVIYGVNKEGGKAVIQVYECERTGKMYLTFYITNPRHDSEWWSSLESILKHLDFLDKKSIRRGHDWQDDLPFWNGFYKRYDKQKMQALYYDSRGIKFKTEWRSIDRNNPLW